MSDFKLPDNFAPDFEKDYAIAGNRFTVQVKAYGILERRWTWVYRISVKGNQIEVGVFYWDPKNRDLTNENVCNHLASYWGHNEKIKAAQKLEPSDEVKMEELIFKCAEWMHKHFRQSEEFQDFEVIQRFMDGNGWEITLSPNYIHGRILEFSQKTGDDFIQINSYIEANALRVKF
jgi:hypothetical protein